MRFLIYSISGDGAGIAWKIKNEGHDVSIFIKEPFFRPILRNMVPHISVLEEGLSQRPDIVIFDMSGDGKVADQIRKQGLRVIGAGAFNDLLEMDRTYGMSLAKRVGIKTPNFTVFKQNQIQDAIHFIEESQGRYVLKPHGNLALDLTYVGEDAEDMIHELEWIEHQGIMKGDFILQDFVKGIEISTEMWFSRGNPISSLANGTIERKKLLTGDLGPATGCESSVVWPYHTDRTPIVDKTISKLYPILKKMEFTGPIDVNAIVSEMDGEPYFLEFTPRFGYSAFYAFAELLQMPLSEFLYNIAIGKIDELTLRDEVAMALTLSIPPYPLDSGKPFNHKALMETQGKPVYDTPEDGFWPYDLMFDDSVGEFVTAGTLGLTCYASDRDECVEAVEEKLYKKVDDIGIPNVQYRVDGAMKAMDYIPELKDKGYATPPCKTEEINEGQDTEDLEEPVSVGTEEDD